MRYLLDVNALIAYGLASHGFHQHVGAWMQLKSEDEFLTCSITELGFIRVLGNVRAYGLDVSHARALLLALKSRKVMPIAFITDTNDIASLPAWVTTPHQVTDGHLAELATANGAVLATFDSHIPGSFLIPASSSTTH